MWASSELSADVCRCRHVVQGLLKNIKIMLKLHIHLYYNFHHYLCPKGPPGTSKRTPRDLQKTSKGYPRDLWGTSKRPQDIQGPPGISRELQGISKEPSGTSKEPPRYLWGTSEGFPGTSEGPPRTSRYLRGTSRDLRGTTKVQGLLGTSRDPQGCQERFLEIFRKLGSFKEFEGFFRSWPHEGKD